jgi:hypothetical protein
MVFKGRVGSMGKGKRAASTPRRNASPVPPAMTTRPSGNAAAVWNMRAPVREPTSEKAPVFGS